MEYEENDSRQDKEDFYNYDIIESSLEDDEIRLQEEAFMIGYLEA